MRDRIAKAIHKAYQQETMHPDDFTDWSKCLECPVMADAVLAELGWDDAPTIPTFTGAYRLIREDTTE